MRRRTAAWSSRTRMVEAWPSPPGWMASRERVTWRMCCVVSYIRALATLVEKPPVRARTSDTRAAPMPPSRDWYASF